MQSHEDIDQRNDAMARAIVARIDADPARTGLAKAREVCRGWPARRPGSAVREWAGVLGGDWESVRAVLLDPSERGKRLRQSSPFCGVLSPRERWSFYRGRGLSCNDMS